MVPAKPVLAIFTVLAALFVLSSCGAGTYLTKPGATLKDYVDDQAACKRAVAAAPAPASPAHRTVLGFAFMDPRITACMEAKGWRRV